MKIYNVYVIGPAQDEFPYYESYVGVTSNLKSRWNQHLRRDSLIGNHIRLNNLNCSCMRSIYTGTQKECFSLERKLRPIPFIGLNEAAGGRGGWSHVNNSGRIKTEAHISNELQSKIRNGTLGNNNPTKTWETRKRNGNVSNTPEQIMKANETNRIKRALGLYKTPKTRIIGIKRGPYKKKIK